MTALIIAGCIGTMMAALILFPAVCAAVPPSSSTEESGAPENGSGFEAGSENVADLLAEPVSDDERLESLIARAGIPLLGLSVEQIHAIHVRDDAALRDRAGELSSLVENLSTAAADLEISPENEPVRSQFIAALDEFAAAGTLLCGGIPVNRSVTGDALNRLAIGTERLSDALQDCSRSPEDNPAAGPMSLDEEPVPAFPDALQPGERFCYDDARRENSASLIAGPITWSHAFQTSGTKPVQYAAEPGKVYLMVAVKATHLGHRGDGTNTRFQTPPESAFTLHYAAETYRPLASPGPTNQGGSYSRVALDRGETVTGYLFFEVPEDLDPARAYLQAKIGKDSPVWRLGGTP
ncbi:MULTISPECIES: hypothetical protein [unclassified Methanoculleus]|jgi:hypothetical protein|nr:hypothetical protein [Methanoculleus sp. UBA377]MDD2473750.1 hypothetical protein [Methanoculleus sp.]